MHEEPVKQLGSRLADSPSTSGINDAFSTCRGRQEHRCEREFSYCAATTRGSAGGTARGSLTNFKLRSVRAMRSRYCSRVSWHGYRDISCTLWRRSARTTRRRRRRRTDPARRPRARRPLRLFKVLNFNDVCDLGISDLYGDGGQSASDLSDPIMAACCGEGLGDGLIECCGRQVERMRSVVQTVD